MHFYDFTSGVGEELKEIPLDPEKCCVRLKVSVEFSIKLGAVRWWRRELNFFDGDETILYKLRLKYIESRLLYKKLPSKVTKPPDHPHNSSPKAPPLGRATETKLMKFQSEFCIFSIAASSTFVDYFRENSHSDCDGNNLANQFPRHIFTRNRRPAFGRTESRLSFQMGWVRGENITEATWRRGKLETNSLNYIWRDFMNKKCPIVWFASFYLFHSSFHYSSFFQWQKRLELCRRTVTLGQLFWWYWPGSSFGSSLNRFSQNNENFRNGSKFLRKLLLTRVKALPWTGSEIMRFLPFWLTRVNKSFLKNFNVH